jgi:5-methylcytosine-specific restriction endonuclease McrA
MNRLVTRRKSWLGRRKPKKVARRGVKKGDVYKCGVCGLAVTVDEVCGCVDYCDIICCEKPMKPKKRA